MSTTHPAQPAVPELESGKTRTRRLVVALAIAVTAVVVGAASTDLPLVERADTAAPTRPSAGSALASPGWSERIGLKYQEHPPWFRNIAKLYGYDPRMTPAFDFASLYSVPRDVPILDGAGQPVRTR